MKNTSRLGKMPSWQRNFVLIGMFSCSLTGVAYLLGHEFQIQRTVLGTHAVLAWHGIAAILASVALGSILPFHLKAGLKSKRKLLSGLSQLGFLVALLISGALLYYGPEEIRESVVLTHYLIGAAFFAIFLLHSLYAGKIRAVDVKKVH
jgi:cytosine/uracil/thiamine/allantoin permease